MIRALGLRQAFVCQAAGDELIDRIGNPVLMGRFPGGSGRWGGMKDQCP